MTSKREDILATIATILSNVTGIGSPARVYRSRPEGARIEETPCIFVNFVSDVPDYDNLSIMNWNMQVRVTIVTNGTLPDQLADPIAVSMHSLLMADRSLGSRVLDILPGEQRMDIVEGNKPVGVLQCLWLIKHRTAQNALDS